MAALVDLQYNYPILEGQEDLFCKMLRQVAADAQIAVRRAPYVGKAEHRETGAKWLSRKGYEIGPERIVTCAGGHNAVMIALLAAGLRGKKVAVDHLTYPGFKVQAEGLGIELVACAGDSEGMLPEELERAAKENKVAAAYLMPTIHNPLGIVMPVGRREAISEVARRHDFVLIDDDAYQFLMADAPPNFATLAPERGFFVCSFTKSFAPGLKLAYLAFPERYAREVGGFADVLCSGAPAIFGESALRLIDSGEMQHIIETKREDARRRQAVAQEIFAGLSVQGYPTAYHAWIELPASVPAMGVVGRLAAENIAVSGSAGYLATPSVKANGIRVALGVVRDDRALRQALETVRRHIG